MVALYLPQLNKIKIALKSTLIRSAGASAKAI